MNKDDIAIDRIKTGAQMSQQMFGKPLMVLYSGGKDSEVLLHLALRAKVPIEVVHNHTSVDAPETVYHVRNTFHELESIGVLCSVEFPVYKGAQTNMWDLIPKKLMPPTRIARYCCSVLKESSGKGRMIATGVRWSESTKRRNSRGIYEKISSHKESRIILGNDNDDRRLLFERCKYNSKMSVNPIIDWSDTDVWDYINYNHIVCNPLYCNGFSRVGCIGCPMAGRHRKSEFRRYPTYKRAYLRAFDEMLSARRERGLATTWGDAQEVFSWWVNQ